MRQLSPLESLLFQTGALLMVCGAACYLLNRKGACVLYVVGALLFVAMQLRATYEGADANVRRLRRSQLFGALCLLLSAVAMAMFTWDISRGSFMFLFTHHGEWVVLLAIGALVELYTAFRIPSQLRRAGEPSADEEQA